MKLKQALKNKKVAVLATDGFEKSELFKPMGAIRNEGAMVDVLSIKEGEIRSWDGDNWIDSVQVHKLVVDEGLTTSRNPNDFAAFMDKTIEEICEGKHEDQVVNT